MRKAQGMHHWSALNCAGQASYAYPGMASGKRMTHSWPAPLELSDPVLRSFRRGRGGAPAVTRGNRNRPPESTDKRMSTERPKTREELYERIRQGSREEFILEDMIRLGFWPAPAELRSEHRRLQNEEALIKEMRKRRLDESRRRRQETKERRERERRERAEEWRRRQGREIVYLGEGVSGGLNRTECDAARLRSYGLRPLGTAADISAALGVTVNELRFLAFDRKTSNVSHYVNFQVPKKTGGLRQISAPMPRLKAAQHWVLRNILELVEAHDCA